MQLEGNDSNKGDKHDDIEADSGVWAGFYIPDRSTETDDPGPRSPAWMELSNE